MSEELFPVTVSYELTDELSRSAVREYWYALRRKLFKPGSLLCAASLAIFVLALRKGDSAWWLILSGASPGIFLLLGIFWCVGLWWFPKAAARRLAHLPSRGVMIAFEVDTVAFRTATERLELNWSEISMIQVLAHFWYFQIRAGTEIPVPLSVLSPQLRDAIRQRVPAGSMKDSPG